jgi:transcriptional regulator with XRE-family HTH domain
VKEVERRHTPYSKFKAFLVENNINQRDVAMLLKKSLSALNQNLNGTGGDFSLKEVRIICKQFNISADDYFLYPEVSKMKLQDVKEEVICNNFKSV